MRLIAMCCVVLFWQLAVKKISQSVNQQPTSAVMPGKALPSNKSPAALLAAFKNEFTVCASAVLTFEKDPAFLSEFIGLNKRQSKPLEAFLSQASFSRSVDIQYILANPEYFVIDVTFHPLRLPSHG